MLWLCIRLPALERAALTRLAVWSQQWSSWVSLGACGNDDRSNEEQSANPEADCWLWLEIGASLKLFGGVSALRSNITCALEALGHEARTAIAPTPQAARLLTRTREPRCTSDAAALRARLSPLRLELLDLPAVALTALRSSGFRHIGQLLDLPSDSVAQRFGPEAALYLQRLCGEAIEPMPAVPFPRHYHARVEFGHEVLQAAALLFPLQRLLWELQGWLRAADRALQHCTLVFEHHGRADTGLTLRCSLPSRDAAQWLALARERFHSFTLPAPVRALHLRADEFTAPAISQADFFAQEAQHSQLLHQVLDRLQARLGTHCMQRLHTTADYRPEHAWRSIATTDTSPQSVTEASSNDATPRPCWLLREPRPLITAPRLVAGPERIESGWWDRGDVARDYYLAQGADGARQWVYQDLRNGIWYLHGLWA